MNKIKIKNANSINDLKLLAKEYASYYSSSVLNEPWNEETAFKLFSYFYKHFQDLFFIAYDNDLPIGLICSSLKPWFDGNHLEDGEIFVITNYQNKQIAKKLLKHLFEYAINKYNVSKIQVHTYENEFGFPYSWYNKIGFKKTNNLFIIDGDIKTILKNLK